MPTDEEASFERPPNPVGCDLPPSSGGPVRVGANLLTVLPLVMCIDEPSLFMSSKIV